MTPAFETAQNHWPDLAVPAARFDAFVAERGDDARHLGDLYLACACADGVPGAAACFVARVLEPLAPFVRRVDASPGFTDEVQQEVAVRLLVEGRIAQYRGRGPLAGWVRAIAVRTAIDLRRAPRRLASLDDAVLAGDDDPTLEALRARHAPALAAAVRAALVALPTRDRAILRMHLVAGMSSEQVGAAHRVHQTTAARWIRDARAAVRARVQVTLGMTSAELRSLAGVLWSRLDVSIAGALA